MRRGLAALIAVLAAAPLPAQRPLVVSPRPDSVAVTVYRNPERRPDEPMRLEWLQGFALITETRTVSLPAGESEVRFEGVAGGILPESAIASGLPVAEKNRDARLLSPGALVDASLGRRVHVRRTDRATGRVTESDAVIRSGPDGIVLQTAEGFEALSCSGLPETLVYDSLPAGLSDRPTLAIVTRSAQAGPVTVRLSYLASDFDWQANYLATVAPDGRTLDLFGWLTLANGNDESFPDAEAQAVAGKTNRVEDDDGPAALQAQPRISLRCWSGNGAAAGDIVDAADSMEIVVTGSRIRENMLARAPAVAMTAEQESLGDLKLYRIPERVTVAANAQKQVALLHRDRVSFQRLYGALVPVRAVFDPVPASILLRMRNVERQGLGLPLPTGSAAVFELRGERPLLVGEAPVADTAVGETFDLLVGKAPDVQVVQRLAPGQDDEDDGDKPYRYEVELSNAGEKAATVEVAFRLLSRHRIERPSRKLEIKHGRLTWTARVPANGRTVLSYTAVPAPEDGVRADEE